MKTSSSKVLEFKSRKLQIKIDYSCCLPAAKNDANPSCGFACVKACRLYGRNILKIDGNKPVLSVTNPDEINRLDNECLSCEYHCQAMGPGCIEIVVEEN